jgi:hypothetical protein
MSQNRPPIRKSERLKLLQKGERLRDFTEKDLDEILVETALKHGWELTYHPLTPIRDEVGFPDRHFARQGCVFVIELKSEEGFLTPEQEKWRTAFESVSDSKHPYRVLKPSNWNEIEGILMGHISGWQCDQCKNIVPTTEETTINPPLSWVTLTQFNGKLTFCTYQCVTKYIAEHTSDVTDKLE